MKNLNLSIVKSIRFLLILLWVYTASSKLLDFKTFNSQMHIQVFPPAIADLLIWILPLTEILATALLVIKRTELVGFYFSFLLMTVFTGYVGLILSHYFPHVPCSCGGIISTLGWPGHFAFNLFYLLLSILGIVLINRERRENSKIN